MAVKGRPPGLMDPNWVHQDQPHAQEWSLRRPAGTTEFQLCLPAKYLTPDHLSGVRPRAQQESSHPKTGKPDSPVLHLLTQEAAP